MSTITIPKTIKTPQVNTFKRVGIDYETLLQDTEPKVAQNRFSGETVTTSALVAHCISWVYKTSNAYERRDYSVKVADFDRVRYFVLAEDRNAYSTCLD